MAIELKVPAAGESITEATIGEWLVEEGAFVEVDEGVVLLETDKASMELPAPVSGVLTKILKQQDEVVAVGEVIGTMEERDAADGDAKSSAETSKDGDEKPPAEEPAGEEPSAEEPPAEQKSEARVMPAARRALHDAGLEASEVEGTGPGGRVLKEDVARHVEEGSKDKGGSKAQTKTESSSAGKDSGKQGGKKEDGGKTEPPTPSKPAAPAPAKTGGPRQEETVRMTQMRRIIAQRLVEAGQNAALLTTFNEVDMSAVMELRRRHQDAFVKRHGIKLGFMSFFVKAVIEGLKEIPGLNAEIRENSIVYKNYYDIGVAVGGGRGLVVPVIRNAERLSFAEVEKTIAELAGRARDNQLTPDELQGGTFTISNGGIYGSMLSTPIVNPPQSGILGMHNIVERPVAVDGEVVIRPIMYLAVTYDHRVVDGREAVTFLVRVKECIENPARILLEV